MLNSWVIRILIMSLLPMIDMAAHVGATFPGRVTSVTRFGLFVALDDTGADGLIPVRTLGQEFSATTKGANS